MRSAYTLIRAAISQTRCDQVYYGRLSKIVGEGFENRPNGFSVLSMFTSDSLQEFLQMIFKIFKQFFFNLFFYFSEIRKLFFKLEWSEERYKIMLVQ